MFMFRDQFVSSKELQLSFIQQVMGINACVNKDIIHVISHFARTVYITHHVSKQTVICLQCTFCHIAPDKAIFFQP